MRGKKRGGKAGSSSLWTEFVEVFPHNRSDDEPVEVDGGETYWSNSFYLVNRVALEPEKGLEGAVRLSMKRHDGKALREWKHMQRVKNELCGEEREAVEIFPPQSMVTSMDHEHHLFVTPVGVASIYVYEEKLRSESLNGYEAVGMTKDEG